MLWKLETPCLMGQQQGGQPIKRINNKEDSPSNASTPDLFNVKIINLVVIFAIAIAVNLAFGESPEKKLLEPNSMRGHLFQCLKKGEFSFFLSIKRKSRKSKNYLGLLNIYCTRGRYGRELRELQVCRVVSQKM